MGPFPKAVGNKKYLLVCTDYFTKWVEAEPLVNIRDVDVKRFIWKNIVTRFGVPNVLISDNGLQFDSKAFRKYCYDLGIRSLSHRALTQGYWWPNMQKEAQEYVKKCDQCQRFTPNTHKPGGMLNPLSSPWPFT